MEYAINAPGFEGRDLKVRSRGFLAGPKLLLDGQPAPKGPKRNQMLLRRNDGQDAVAQFRVANVIDPVPQVVIDGQTIQPAPPLKWYEWVWGVLPFALIVVGGLLGGLFGAGAAYINGYIFRSDLSGALKFVLTGLISLAAAIFYLIIAVGITLLLNRAG